MTQVIEATGLTKWYGKRRGVLDVSFAVDEAEVFGFLGPNGAGKTTTIRLLLGFLRPTSGAARVLGRDAWREAPAAHRGLSYVSSDPGYLGELTAREQLDYMAGLRGLPRGAWRGVAERLELDPTIPIRKLSRGNRQKVAVVQAFMGDERLLVMDEPTSRLDPLMQREFLKLVAEARAAGRTVFLSSHNLPEVERSCDRVAIVREGRLVSISSVGELQASHWRSVNLVLGDAPPAGLFDLPDVRVVSADARDVHLMVRGDVNPLLRRLATIDVRDVSVATLDIEDVFLGFYEAGAAGSGADRGDRSDDTGDRRAATATPGVPGEEASR
ncbi:MAG TPA: ABC transporter ATP-binding protein [Candidatus Dormibacteraeota bacterium]|nr:ABC transporter ATP-binding protein [Candidatus Dormibacteraeota bacterium]